MKRILSALAALLLASTPAPATNWFDAGGAGTDNVAVHWLNGSSIAVPVSASNPLPISGSFSATLGAFTPTAVGTPLSVTTTSARVALPAGTTVVVYNTGASAAYVALGNGSVTATSSNDLIQPGSWIAFSPGAATNIAAITASGTTTLNLSGGSGLPTGAGGGSSGGGGGTVAQGTAAAAGGAWPTYLTQGGSVLSAGNGIFVNPATGATFAISAASLPLPTGAATSANQPTNAAIASTTSGQTGNLHMGAVTTAAPSYTTGQTDPLSLTTAGALRVDASATTQPVSAASLPLPTGASTAALQPTNAGIASTTSGQTGHLVMGAVTTAAPSYTTAQTNPLSLTTTGALRVDPSAVTQPVSAASLPLPTGASTSAIQSETHGTVAAGTAATKSELAGGVFNTALPTLTNGQQAAIQLDSSGREIVSVGVLPSIPAGANTIGTVNLGTLNGAALDASVTNVQGTVAAGTAATKSALAGGVFNSSAPTLTTGQQAALQLTSAGSLHTTIDNANANGAATTANSAPVTESNQPPGAGTISTAQVSCATTATTVVSARTGVAGTGRAAVTITNTTTTAIYIGTSGVTTTTGQLLPGIVGASLTLNTTAAVSCIVASGTATVTEIESF